MPKTSLASTEGMTVNATTAMTAAAAPEVHA
jgi:hypothetical protein